MLSAAGRASEWLMHIDLSVGDASLGPPPYTHQWALYDGESGDVLWSANNTLDVTDLYCLFSNATTAAVAVEYGDDKQTLHLAV